MFADPKPGVPEVISRLRTKGYAIGSTTGYTDKMMEIVAPAAKEKGYEPDWLVQPGFQQNRRPSLSVYDIQKYGKAWNYGCKKSNKGGDTVSDIKEGKNAGAFSVGVIVGSSELGLSQEEFEALSWQEQQEKCKKTAQRFLDAGADKVVYTLEELAEFLGA